jgi:hypothetical protein
MKLDYLSHQQFQPRKPWWEKEMSKEEQSAIYLKIIENPTIAGQSFANLALHEREVHKQTLLIPFTVDLYELAQDKFESKDGYLLTFFKPGQSPQFSFIQKEQVS